jgi:peroxiredoxin
MATDQFPAAPEWQTSEWLNVSEPLDLPMLRGRAIVLLAFQMLCPGCVQTALPQLSRVHETFDHDRVVAIGLHTVFEHHAAMSPTTLRAFVGEYKFGFPVAVDHPGETGGMPLTMRGYQMQGTPTLILIDAMGRLRQQTFGHETDLKLGAAIMALMLEADGART